MKLDHLGALLGSAIWLTTIGVCINGCTANSSPPPPLVDNSQLNATTDRQKLVREFRTAEVHTLPDDRQFIVRDTNGAVWFVQSGRDGHAVISGKTLIFGPTHVKGFEVSFPLPYAEEPEPPEPPEITQARIAAALLRDTLNAATSMTNKPAN